MKILIAGDFVPRHRVHNLVEDEHYESIFGKAKPVITSADYAIVNFESPVCNGKYIPIEKCGPNLQCTNKAVSAIKYAGFQGAALANNHILDFGENGVKDTISCCKKYGIDTVGAGTGIDDASSVLYKKIGTQTLAIINCCEHEFSIATEQTAGANPLNPVRQYYAIEKAKENADHVLVIVHGGHEHYQLPSPRMVETYRFFIDAGADAVVNHHQHCYSGYETYKGKPIFYGLGNFCFDVNPIRTDDIWNYGYMAEIDFDTTITFKIHPYKQCGEKAQVEMLPENSFNSRLNELNAIIGNQGLLEQKTAKYYAQSMSCSASFLEPIQNRYIHAAQLRHLLPSLLTKRWLIKLQNYVLCEAHRDKLDYYLKHKN